MIHYMVWVAMVLGLLVLLADGRKLIPREAFRSEQMASLTPVMVSVAVVVAAAAMILSSTDDDWSQKLAYGVVGTVVGFWLRK